MISKKNAVSTLMVIVTLLCISHAPANADNPLHAFSRWPDTGQDKCYTGGNIGYGTGIINCPAEGEAYYGQDAQYDIHSPSYTKIDADGNDLPDAAPVWSMVRDNVTGLIWEVKTDDDSIHDQDNTYTWCDSDPDTNGGNAGTCGDGTDSEDFIRALNEASFGGHADWRLPTVEELSSLLNAHRQNPSIDVNYFPHTVTASYYWTATSATYYSASYYGNGDQAWAVNFYSGNVNSDYFIVKSNSLPVRAVRGGASPPVDHLSDNGVTVTDSNTCLTWQKMTADVDSDGTPDQMTWTEALAYAEGLTLDGHDDWRLPSSAELQALVDYSRAVPAVDTTYFPDTAYAAGDSQYWTSTTTPNLGTGGIAAINAKMVSLAYGRVEAGIKSESHYVRVVRSAPCDAAVHLWISDRTPVSGYALDTSITITGNNFGNAQGTGSVTFDSVPAAITSWSDTEIVCVAPAHDPGKVTVEVTNDNGQQARTTFSYYDKAAASILREAASLPDTGQTKCYNASGEITCPSPGSPFYGQDAQYTINPPSYTKLDAAGNDLPDSATEWAMVRDNVTGLIWEVKSSDSASLHYAGRTLPWCNTNPATNGGNAGYCEGYGYDTEDFIDELNEAGFGGYHDWRMPSMADLTTLMHHGQYKAFSPDYFPNMSRNYWSGTSSSDNNGSAWYVSYNGPARTTAKTGKNVVIAVRGGVPHSHARFIDNGNGTVTDTRACLTWQQTGMDIDGDGTPDKLTWEQALEAAENLELGGHDDWRLPNRKELQAVMDYSHPGFYMDTNFFPHSSEPYYWSSTTSGFSSQAWMVSFNYYYGVYATSKTSSYYVRAVRTASCQPVISSISPGSGYSGSPVIIQGNGFGDTRATGNVTFDTLPATVISWSDTEIVCDPPAHPVGEVTVDVVNFAGNAASTTFTYLNAPPVISQGESVTVTMSEDSDPTPFSLTLEATDAEGDQLTWSVTSQAGHGSASIPSAGNSVQPAYIPVTNYRGHDSFQCSVNDGHGGVDTITVNIDIVNTAVQMEIDQAVSEAVTAARQTCDQEIAQREQTISDLDNAILYLKMGDFDLDSDVDGDDLADFSSSFGKTEIDVDNDDDGYAEIDGDCDDSDPAVNPAANEISADGIDNNCDGQVDEESCL